MIKLDVSLIYKGEFTADISHLKGRLIDLPKGAMRGMRASKPGIEEVVAELRANVPISGALAGISPEVFAHFDECTGNIEDIDASLRLLAKMTEVLLESRAHYVHEQHQDIGVMVDSARSTAHRRKDPALLAPFEKTVEYNSRSGLKAARARRRNQEQASEAESQT